MSTVLKISFAISLALNAYLCFCLWSWAHPDTYSVTRSSNGSFVLEHKGDRQVNRYTVQCRESVVWPDGFMNPAKPSGACMYLRNYAGKTVPTQSIQINGGTFLYMPLARYGANALQVADVFSIEDHQILQ